MCQHMCIRSQKFWVLVWQGGLKSISSHFLAEAVLVVCGNEGLRSIPRHWPVSTCASRPHPLHKASNATYSSGQHHIPCSLKDLGH